MPECGDPRAAHIRQVADVLVTALSDSRGMEIRIVLRETEPPSGHVERAEGDVHHEATDAAIRFTGWLGLLRALSTVIGQPYPPSKG